MCQACAIGKCLTLSGKTQNSLSPHSISEREKLTPAEFQRKGTAPSGVSNNEDTSQVSPHHMLFPILHMEDIIPLLGPLSQPLTCPDQEVATKGNRT